MALKCHLLEPVHVVRARLLQHFKDRRLAVHVAVQLAAGLKIEQFGPRLFDDDVVSHREGLIGLGDEGVVVIGEQADFGRPYHTSQAA